MRPKVDYHMQSSEQNHNADDTDHKKEMGGKLIHALQASLQTELSSLTSKDVLEACYQMSVNNGLIYIFVKDKKDLEQTIREWKSRTQENWQESETTASKKGFEHYLDVAIEYFDYENGITELLHKT
jgi:DNA modification methylase